MYFLNDLCKGYILPLWIITQAEWISCPMLSLFFHTWNIILLSPLPNNEQKEIQISNKHPSMTKYSFMEEYIFVNLLILGWEDMSISLKPSSRVVRTWNFTTSTIKNIHTNFSNCSQLFFSLDQPQAETCTLVYPAKLLAGWLAGWQATKF